LDFVTAHHGVSDAIEIENRRLAFQAYLDHALPLAALHETRHRALHQLFTISVALLDEIGQRSADNLLERRVHEIGKTAVDGTDLAVKRNGE